MENASGDKLSPDQGDTAIDLALATARSVC